MTVRAKSTNLVLAILGIIALVAVGGTLPVAATSSIIFVDSGQRLGGSRSWNVALGDVDSDGDLDAFVANVYWLGGEANRLWLNDGTGVLTDSGQNLSSSPSFSVALGDLDNDGDLDAFIGNYWGTADEVWVNNGTGIFSDSGQRLGNFSSTYGALGDLDGDGDLDAFVAGYGPNKVWLNDGTGVFTDSDQNLGNAPSRSAALEDLDNDGDLDAFVANDGANKVWLNDKNGIFTDNGQNLGTLPSWDVALGDVDMDGDLDAAVSNGYLWLNDGTAIFTNSGQGISGAGGIAMGDVDKDGNLDVVVTGGKVWLNDGEGTLIDSGQSFSHTNIRSLALGDLNGDGNLDVFLANWTYAYNPFPGLPNEVWLNVLPPNSPPVADVGGPYTANEGETLTLDASGSTDPDGNIAAYEWDLDNDGEYDDASGISTTIVCIDDGNFTAGLKVTDEFGEYDTSAAQIAVHNVPPTVEVITAPVYPIEVNTAIDSGAEFTDAGVLDTHTAVWDWGDGSTSSGIVDEMCGHGSAGGSHIYTAAGIYTVRLTVTDKDGGIGESIFQYVVVYDREGGFVTGGGWIDSPEGAYVPDPTLTGQATFGFVSKYKKGADVPTGQTEFQFQVADLNFHSDSYQWLVVAGAKAKFKGEGTINGVGTYGFMLTAVDASLTPSTDVDLFRIKIWDKDNGDVVVYDNQMDAADDADPTTTIGGGNIVVHK